MATLLTKQAVAHRLILSAVQLIDECHDPITAHLAAASASNMLRELISKRGQNYGTRVLRAALYEAALAEIEEREPIGLLPDIPAIAEAVASVRNEIKTGNVRSADEIDVDMPKGVERAALHQIIAPFNFMKHADRDSNELLHENEIQPIEATLHAITAYALLFPGEPLSDAVKAFIENNVIDD